MSGRLLGWAGGLAGRAPPPNGVGLLPRVRASPTWRAPADLAKGSGQSLVSCPLARLSLRAAKRSASSIACRRRSRRRRSDRLLAGRPGLAQQPTALKLRSLCGLLSTLDTVVAIMSQRGRHG